MDSSATLSSRPQVVSKECDTRVPATKYLSSRRTPSFSSSSSLSPCSSSLGSSYFPDDSPLSPATPLRYSGVPFSWEQLPGIPKKLIQAPKKKEYSSSKLLPLPPLTAAAAPPPSKKSNPENMGDRKKINPRQSGFQRDPFFAALVECSKDDDIQDSSNNSIWTSGKVSRSLSDRFGFVSLYASCKRTCAISESIIYLPKSNRGSYDLIHHDHRSR
ncbi:uncharacterized protein LOC132190286 [Corylus avellana]|uniref:uncharacterized protein LOC132190286 n=1 Tax=Corylus avellana TaxID=13451 RepID=UPI00286C0D06|nr:uncharacterized protein LOC132190286 [Corylus avellana]